MPAKPINGDEVEIHYGDQVIGLPEIVRKLRADLDFARKALVVMGVLLLIHSLIPAEHILPFILKMIGL